MIYIEQLKGPFKNNEDLDTKMVQGLGLRIFKIGIFSKPHHIVSINNIEFEIGKTGMLEFRDIEVFSIKFKQDEDLNSYIDYMVEK